MLGTIMMLKNNILKPVLGEITFKNFREIKPEKYRSMRFYNRKLTVNPSKIFLFGNRNSGRISSLRFSSIQDTIGPENENDPQTKIHFQDLLHARKMQAQRSVLVKVMKKEDIPYAVTYCEKYGSIENVFSYSGENKTCYILLELSQKDDAEELLSNWNFNDKGNAPRCNRLILFKKKDVKNPSKINVHECSIASSSSQKGDSVSHIIQNIYVTEKLTELETRLRFFYCFWLRDFLSGLFPYCEALPFGSSVNGTGKHGCDLDVVMMISEKVNGNGEPTFIKTKKFQQNSIKHVKKIINKFLPGNSSVKAIWHARVPILTIKNTNLKIDFDLSVNNMSAVYMSSIIHFLGEIDDRVRPLMFAVKKWAEETRITRSSLGPKFWISNFGLINLVIFFLQNRPQPVLPPLNNAIVIIGEDDSCNFQVRYLKSIKELKSCAGINKESLAVLLKEFFSFLATESFDENIISLMTGKKRARYCEVGLPMWMQYPMDEGLNITKNVSFFEFENMREKAKISHKCMENNLKDKVNSITDFSRLLCIPSARRIGFKGHKK